MTVTVSEAPPSQANRVFRALRFVGRGLIRSLFHVEVDGLDLLPPGGGYVLVCNHLSWIDPLILMAHLPAEPRIHYLAAAEYTVNGPWLVRKVVAAAGGIIPVDRQSHKGNRTVVVEAVKVLRGGGILGIFPEGRCGFVEGEVQELKEGAASFAVKTGRPVQVVGISGTQELYFRKRIQVRVGALLEPGAEEGLEEMLERLHQAMCDTVPPLNPNQPRRKYLLWINRIFG